MHPSKVFLLAVALAASPSATAATLLLPRHGGGHAPIDSDLVDYAEAIATHHAARWTGLSERRLGVYAEASGATVPVHAEALAVIGHPEGRDPATVGFGIIFNVRPEGHPPQTVLVRHAPGRSAQDRGAWSSWWVSAAAAK